MKNPGLLKADTDNWLNDKINLELKNYFQDTAMDILGGIAIIDRDGILIYINSKYAKATGIDKKLSLGKHVDNVVKYSKLLKVVETGEPIIGELYVSSEETYVINRFPIMKENQIIGAIGLSTYESNSEINKLRSTLDDMNEQLNYYKSKAMPFLSTRYSIDSIISNNHRIEQLKNSIINIAKTKSTVLISGESGTGKELFSQAIHEMSPRRDKPFIAINCAAIPENLLESELFGYEKGSFTGALKEGKSGDFEMANGGTLLLDEIDSLPLSMQAKLLRVIQEKEVKKNGGSNSIKLDVRLICTTNKNLFELVEANRFREDLYYRINVINLNIPALKDRIDDLPILIDHFIRKYNHEMGTNVRGITDDTIALLSEYSWPGNIRELENCIERAFNFVSSENLDSSLFREIQRKTQAENKNKLTDEPWDETITLEDMMNSTEKVAILNALSTTKGNKSKAAELLGINRSLLYSKLNKYNI